MLHLTFDRAERPLKSVLCLGAHCDDIEIGCGGTLLRLTAEQPGLRVHWVVLSSNPVRAVEARRSAGLFLAQAGEKEIAIREFRESYFPYEGGEIKDYFETLKDISPDLIFTHYRHDLHQDHRLVSELTWNTFRDHLILEYEVPKYDGDLGSPNVYVDIDETLCRRKVNHIMEAYASQKDKRWFTEDTFLGLMRLRCVESNAAGRYAEGFYARKIII